MSLFGNYMTPTFTDIFPDVEAFVLENQNNELSVMNEADARVIYYLLYARYGNSSIAATDRNRFIYQLFSIIFSYGPTWSKRVEIQRKLREIPDADLLIGSKAIYNHSYNPDTAPSTATLQELPTIDAQNTTIYKKSVMEGYTILLSLLETDLTSDFLDKFKRLFLTVVAPQEPLIYEMTVDLED